MTICCECPEALVGYFMCVAELTYFGIEVCFGVESILKECWFNLDMVYQVYT